MLYLLNTLKSCHKFTQTSLFEMENKKKDPMVLITRAQKGDSEAFGELYEDFFTPIFRFILPKVSDHRTAEDLTQMVFIKVFESIQNFKYTGSSPLSYFFTVARNTVFDFYKKKKDIVIGENNGDDSINIFHNIEDDSPIPDERLKISEKQNFILKEIDKLHGDQKTIITMKFIDGLKNPEIADILEKTEDSIRQTQCRALKKLKSQFYNKKGL